MKHDLDHLDDVKLEPSAAKAENRRQRTDAELDEENLEDYGDIRIADEVISIVASLAAQEVPGVLSMSGGLTDGINRFLGKENASKGVRLKFEGKTVNASVYINVEYGSCIPEIALEVQEKVKEAIEAMTGYEVQFVDVNVEGVAKRQATELEKEATSDEAMAEIVRAQAQRAEATEVNSFEQQLAGLRNEQQESFADTSVKSIKKKHENAADKPHGNDHFELPPEEEMDARQMRFFEED
ncbi:MAG: Asp23/Gls24 family envelope stress response protein [Phascolarctobacterium sp.]|nr:Asp23/Gls24 family envelope stress response protein [Phascolarctobacterium sp.]